ncbi:MAG: ComF family protein [Woeseiaceae bacterium]|nr:ComF family protein [Woeseiaceae bacterium]
MLLRALHDAIMPLRCVFCGTRSLPTERYVCRGCRAELPCMEAPPPAPSSPFAVEAAPFAWSFPVDAAIKALKFGRKLYYAPALAELLGETCRRLPDDIDAVLPVPLHWRRRVFRGFNQAEEIARPVARQLGVPLVRNVARCKSTSFQSGLSARQRAVNLRGAFAVRGAMRWQHVLIVDDIITTGTTVRQVAAVLASAGVNRVSALAVARA